VRAEIGKHGEMMIVRKDCGKLSEVQDEWVASWVEIVR